MILNHLHMTEKCSPTNFEDYRQLYCTMIDHELFVIVRLQWNVIIDELYFLQKITELNRAH